MDNMNRLNSALHMTPIRDICDDQNNGQNHLMTMSDWYKRGSCLFLSSILFGFCCYMFGTANYGYSDVEIAKQMIILNYGITYSLVLVSGTLFVLSFYESWWTLKNKRVREFNNDNSIHITSAVFVILGAFMEFVFIIVGLFIIVFDCGENKLDDCEQQISHFKHLVMATFFMGVSFLLRYTKENIVDLMILVKNVIMMPFEIIAILFGTVFEKKVEAIVEKKLV
jgi:hypothetical protein